MATFQNQAAITWGGTTRLSNITTGQIVDVVNANKTPVVETYATGDTLTYVVNINNTGDSALSGLTVTDDLGAYEAGDPAQTLTPLTYVEDSLLYFINGVPQPTPTVTADPALTVTDISVPAEGTATLVYQAAANEFAPLGCDGEIVNTATVSGEGLCEDVVTDATVSAICGVDLSILKSVSPETVTCGERVTYSFLIENDGGEAADAETGAVVTDSFDPILSDVVVTLGGVTLTEGTGYTYDEATGEFATIPGVLTVPAATYEQDPATGAWTTIPGTVTLTVAGNI